MAIVTYQVGQENIDHVVVDRNGAMKSRHKAQIGQQLTGGTSKCLHGNRFLVYTIKWTAVFFISGMTALDELRSSILGSRHHD